MSAPTDPTQGDFDAWSRLAHSPGLSRSAARTLLAAFGSPQAVLEAPAQALQALVSARATAALLELDGDRQDRLTSAHRWLDGSPRRGWLALGDPRYPDDLLQAPDPPLLLYFEGDIETLGRRALAIVGSRNPTPYGKQAAADLSSRLASEGWLIVSGLALGIDAQAHQGALDAGGLTAAVVATGLDQVYPGRNRDLAARICQHGLMLSEFAPGTPPLQGNFPQRNRIIAGLTQGVLVVEAALKSGSLITARLAVESGRDVFAVPGSIHSALSRGCHALIKQGAKLVECAEDILDELTGQRGARPATAGGMGPSQSSTASLLDGVEQDPLLAALGFEPATLDALCARTGFSASELSSRLLERELCGEVVRLPGGLYQRVGRA